MVTRLSLLPCSFGTWGASAHVPTESQDWTLVITAGLRGWPHQSFCGRVSPLFFKTLPEGMCAHERGDSARASTPHVAVTPQCPLHLSTLPGFGHTHTRPARSSKVRAEIRTAQLPCGVWLTSHQATGQLKGGFSFQLHEGKRGQLC